MDFSTLLTSTQSKTPWLLQHLRELVLVESPSEDPAAVNAAMGLTATWATALGGRVKRHKQKNFGDVYELRFGPPRSRQKPILLLGHLDTVWPHGTLKSMPWREADGKL